MFIACNPTDKKSSEAEPEQWIRLFNGKDLEDWIIKINKHPLGENYNNTFQVRDSLLVTSYEGYDAFDEEFGHIFYKTPFSHYKLRVEYRIVGEQVEGDTVLTYSKPRIGGDLPEGFPLPEGTPVTSGYIALQAESHPFEFRKVELLDLSK
ncbi:MAG: family 16 glycoside hydrolase [Bacteroidales bacterium]